MKSNKNYVASAKLLGIANYLGCTVETQKGFLKITKPGIEGKALYIGNTKGVARVDLSGFRVDIEGVVAHNKPPTSKVEQMIDFAREEPLVLKTFAEVIKTGLTAESQALVGKRANRKTVAEPSKEEVDASVLAACGA